MKVFKMLFISYLSSFILIIVRITPEHKTAFKSNAKLIGFSRSRANFLPLKIKFMTILETSTNRIKSKRNRYLTNETLDTYDLHKVPQAKQDIASGLHSSVE